MVQDVPMLVMWLWPLTVLVAYGCGYALAVAIEQRRRWKATQAASSRQVIASVEVEQQRETQFLRDAIAWNNHVARLPAVSMTPVETMRMQ